MPASRIDLRLVVRSAGRATGLGGCRIIFCTHTPGWLTRFIHSGYCLLIRYIQIASWPQGERSQAAFTASIHHGVRADAGAYARHLVWIYTGQRPRFARTRRVRRPPITDLAG